MVEVLLPIGAIVFVMAVTAVTTATIMAEAAPRVPTWAAALIGAMFVPEFIGALFLALFYPTAFDVFFVMSIVVFVALLVQVRLRRRARSDA